MGDLEEEEPQLEALPQSRPAEEEEEEGQTQRRSPEFEDEPPPRLSGTGGAHHHRPLAGGEVGNYSLQLSDGQEEAAQDEADFDRMLQDDIRAAEACDPLAGRMGLMAQERSLADHVRRDVDQELWKELDDFEGAKEEEAGRSAFLSERDEAHQGGGSTTEEEGAFRRPQPPRPALARPRPKPLPKGGAAAGAGGARRGGAADGEAGEEDDGGVAELDEVGFFDEGLTEADEVYRKKLEASLEDHLCDLRLEEQARSDALLVAAEGTGPAGLPGSPGKRGVLACGSGDIAGGE